MKERSVDRKSERCGCGKVFEERVVFLANNPPKRSVKKRSLLFSHTHNTYYSIIITFITREGGKNASLKF